MSRWRLVWISLCIKIIQVVCLIVVNQLFEDYDQSGDLLLEKGDSSLLSATVRWDSMFFLKIAEKGYEYEKNHAFFQAYPLLIRGITHILSIVTNFTLIKGLMFSALLLNLLLHQANTLLLFEITLMKFPKHGEKFAQIVSFLYAFSPSSAFYSAVYTESLFTFLILLYLFLFYRNYPSNLSTPNLSHDRNISSPPHPKTTIDLFVSTKSFAFSLPATLFLSLSVFVRSNGLFWVVIIGYPILEAFIINLHPKRFRWNIFLNTLFWGIINLICITIPYFLVLKNASNIYCNKNAPYYNDSNSQDDLLPPWCNSLVPNVYSYIQDKHWNVGFLTYYKLSRMFFIIWGIYTFILIGSYIIKFLRVLLMAQLNQKKKTHTLNIFSYGSLNAHMIYTTILFFISVCLAHSQSSTRFFSSDPSLYWFLADLLFKLPRQKDQTQSKTSKVQAILGFAYLTHFNIAGIFLFSNYLSWT